MALPTGINVTGIKQHATYVDGVEAVHDVEFRIPDITIRPHGGDGAKFRPIQRTMPVLKERFAPAKPLVLSGVLVDLLSTEARVWGRALAEHMGGTVVSDEYITRLHERILINQLPTNLEPLVRGWLSLFEIAQASYHGYALRNNWQAPPTNWTNITFYREDHIAELLECFDYHVAVFWPFDLSTEEQRAQLWCFVQLVYGEEADQWTNHGFPAGGDCSPRRTCRRLKVIDEVAVINTVAAEAVSVGGATYGTMGVPTPALRRWPTTPAMAEMLGEWAFQHEQDHLIDHAFDAALHLLTTTANCNMDTMAENARKVGTRPMNYEDHDWPESKPIDFYRNMSVCVQTEISGPHNARAFLARRVRHRKRNALAEMVSLSGEEIHLCVLGCKIVLGGALQQAEWKLRLDVTALDYYNGGLVNAYHSTLRDHVRRVTEASVNQRASRSESSMIGDELEGPLFYSMIEIYVAKVLSWWTAGNVTSHLSAIYTYRPLRSSRMWYNEKASGSTAFASGSYRVPRGWLQQAIAGSTVH